MLGKTLSVFQMELPHSWCHMTIKEPGVIRKSVVFVKWLKELKRCV